MATLKYYDNGVWKQVEAYDPTALHSGEPIQELNIGNNNINYSQDVTDSNTLVISCATENGVEDGTNNISIGGGDKIIADSAGSLGYIQALWDAGYRKIYSTATNGLISERPATSDGTIYVLTGEAIGVNAMSLSNGIANGPFNVAVGRGCYSGAGTGDTEIENNSGKASYTFGYENVCDTQDDMLIGQRNYAHKVRGAYVFGSTNTVNNTSNSEGDTSVQTCYVIGYNNKSHADTTFNIGVDNTLTYENSYVFGRGLTVGNKYQTFLGFHNKSDSRMLFGIGDGKKYENGEINHHTAFYLLNDSHPEYKDGQATHAYLTCGLGIGLSGGSVAAGAQSLLVGTGEVKGNYSVVSGETNKCYYNNCIIAGEGLIASANNQALFGKYSGHPTDTLWVVGNGSSSKRSNAAYLTANRMQVNVPTTYDALITMNATPTNPHHVATKKYVDDVAAGGISFNYTGTYSSSNPIVLKDYITNNITGTSWDGKLKWGFSGSADMAGYLSNSGTIKITDTSLAESGSQSAGAGHWVGTLNLASALDTNFMYMIIFDLVDSLEHTVSCNMIFKPNGKNNGSVIYVNEETAEPYTCIVNNTSTTQISMKLFGHAYGGLTGTSLDIKNAWVTTVCRSAYNN